MTEERSPIYPTFDEAVERFRAFAHEQGVDGDLVYVSDADVVILGKDWFVRRVDAASSRALARDAYEAAVVRGLGVSITGVCTVESAVGVHVSGPVDPDEAERLMYPNGLKLSLVTDLPKATPLRWVPWIACRLSRTHEPRHDLAADRTTQVND